jgi:regulator of cell morphogenesis and NO signaling
MRTGVETTTATSLTQSLGDDHLEIDVLLADLRAMIADREIERAEAHLPDVADRLLHHIRVEDEVLLPILDRRVPHFRPSSVMRHEHRRIEALLALLERQLGAGQEQEASATFQQLERLLAEHNRREEHILYPFADHELSDDEQQLVVVALRSRR